MEIPEGRERKKKERNREREEKKEHRRNTCNNDLGCPLN